MFEPILTERSALARVVKPGHIGASAGAAGVFIQERTGLYLGNLASRTGQLSLLDAQMRERFDMELPLTAKVAHASRLDAIGTAPDHWLLFGQASSGLRHDLEEAVSSHAALVEQSDGRAVLRIGGPSARDILAKGIGIDLHPRVFGPGDAATTVISHMGVVLWQVSTVPTYNMVVFRSFAESFFHWLLGAAAEFGAEILPPIEPR